MLLIIFIPKVSKFWFSSENLDTRYLMHGESTDELALCIYLFNVFGLHIAGPYCAEAISG
jgi:hypothetical protein